MALQLEDLINMEVVIYSNKHLEDKINAESKSFYTIDVHSAMTSLHNVGQILKLAYASSKGFPCSTPILKILSRYQSMITNSSVTTSVFVNTCLKALQLHKNALVMAEKDKMDISMKMLEKCSDLAKAMAEESDKLVKEAADLCNLSEEALLTAQNDENVSTEEKKRLQCKILESKARVKEFEAKNKEIQDEIELYKQKEIELAKKADEQEKRKFVLNLLTVGMSPLTSIGNSASKLIDAVSTLNSGESVNTSLKIEINDSRTQTKKSKKNKKRKNKKNMTEQEGQHQSQNNETSAKEDIPIENEGQKQQQTNVLSDMNENSPEESLAEQEIKIAKLRFELQKEKREANAEIARISEILKGLTGQETSLSASIPSLELSIQALGKIKITFENTRKYWLGVDMHCKALIDVSQLKLMNDPDLKPDFIQALNASAFSWLTLGKINYKAQLSISDVANKTNNILNNLPNKQEAIEIVQNQADQIINSFLDE